MSKLTVDECKRIIMQGKKQLTAAEQRIAELEANNGSRWFELFGSPERTAQTLMEVFAMCNKPTIYCAKCPLSKAPACYGNDDGDYDAFLEWMRGDA